MPNIITLLTTMNKWCAGVSKSSGAAMAGDVPIHHLPCAVDLAFSWVSCEVCTGERTVPLVLACGTWAALTNAWWGHWSEVAADDGDPVALWYAVGVVVCPAPPLHKK